MVIENLARSFRLLGQRNDARKQGAYGERTGIASRAWLAMRDGCPHRIFGKRNAAARRDAADEAAASITALQKGTNCANR